MKKLIPKFILNLYYKLLAVAADIFYGHPSGKLVVIGVTGTNGKSTTVNLIGYILEEAGYKVGWTSTMNFKIDKKEWLNNTKMTMPGRFQLQKMLGQMVKAGCEYAIIETSSEGIKQFRHLGIATDAAVFTNLTPEHIESHGGFENYRRAKMELFRHTARGIRKQLIIGKEKRQIKKISVVNIDDENAPYFLQWQTDEAWGFGIKNRGEANISRIVRVLEPRVTAEGTRFKIRNTEFNLKLLGEFNIYNALAAITTVLSQGVDLQICKSALENVSGMPGRMEFIDEGQNFKVLVDYAPEPASLKQLYKLLQATGIKDRAAKIIHILGSAGGGRDISRRPILGGIAARNADVVIVTDEDPYDDDPQLIINQVAKGAIKEGKVEGENLFKILDRGVAIQKAVNMARENDLLIITGKGCEQAMVVRGNKKVPWDDREVARRMIREKLQISNSK